MQDGRANVPQKNARWPSKRMRDGRAKVKKLFQEGRKIAVVEQNKNGRRKERTYWVNLRQKRKKRLTARDLLQYATAVR
jgi:hypothetical protein